MTAKTTHYQSFTPRSTNIGGYRYFFNGQEGDNEVFGENSLFAFEYRMHDARLGRFWSVDPLAAKYPWNSTYVFAENRVVEGLDMEGSEYLDANKSRFEFKQGGVHLKVSNFLWINRKRWENAASYPQNWTNNSETNQKDIGISTMVSPIYVLHGATDIPMGSIDNTYGAVDPSYNPTDHKIENPKTKSSNYTLDDKRYANRNVSSASPSTGKWARGILAIDILNVLVEQYISITAFYENRIIEKQKKYIDYVLRDINEAIEHKPEIIPNEYRNIQSITNIMNVILQGENNTDDPMIDKIGMKIFNSISKKNIQQSEE